MQFRRSASTLALVSLSMALVACTSPSVVDPLPSVAVEPLTVPDSMVLKQPLVDVRGSALPATDTLPFAFGGSVIDPGKPSVPAVWLSDDGKDWHRAIVDPTFEGSFSGRFAGSDSLAAIGGTQWKDRALTSKLWVSTDRETWTSVSLPEDFASRFRINLLTVFDKRVFAIGVAADGEAAAVSVVGSKVASVDLPKPKKDELLSPGAIVETSDGLLLLASPGPEGDLLPTMSFWSADSGKTWSSQTQLAGATSGMSGAVWTGSEFVATGYAPSSDTPGASVRARAWTSPDGQKWTEEAIPDPPSNGPFFLKDEVNEWLGVPQQLEGRVAVIAANENASVSALYERSPDGVWSFKGITSVNEASGESGYAIPASDGSDIALLGSTGYLRTGRFTDGVYADGTRISQREFLNQVDDFYAGRDRELLILSRSVFSTSENYGWRNSRQSDLAELSGGTTVTVTEWEPPEVSSLFDVTMAVDDSGAEVALGSEFVQGQAAIVVSGYYRAAGETEWNKASGFPTQGAMEFFKVIPTDKGWVAVGQYREDSYAGTTAHGVIWTSEDGVTWTQSDGDFGSGRLATSISDVCTLPNGAPIAFGWVEQSTASYRMAAWSHDSQVWSKVDLGKSAEREGYASSCASDGKGIVVSGTISGRSVLVHTADGTSWKRVFTADRGRDLHDPVAVPGGFAAAGSWSNDTTAGAVVWLSKDGIEWKPVAVPSQNMGSTALLAAYGDDLLITMSAKSGNPLLVLRDVKDAIGVASHEK